MSTALAIGDVTAESVGILNLAAAVDPGGSGTSVFAGNPTTGTDIGNIAISLGEGNGVSASTGFGNIAVSLGNRNVAPGNQSGVSARDGFGNIATNFGDNNIVRANGILNSATSIGGNGNDIVALTPANTLGLNTAFALFGNHVEVTAYPGPLAIAGSILQTNQTVTKAGPGFNINGATLGGAAAPATATTVKAAAVATGQKKATGFAATPNHTSKKLNAHAASAKS